MGTLAVLISVPVVIVVWFMTMFMNKDDKVWLRTSMKTAVDNSIKEWTDE